MAVQTTEPTPAVGKSEEGAYANLINAENEVVESLKAKLVEVSDKIAERSGGREEYNRQRDALREEIATVNQAITRITDERQALNNRDSETTDFNRQSRARVENFQRTAVHRTVAGIDARLKEIEYTIMTSTMTNKEEKALSQEAEKLRRLKPEVAEMERLENQLLMSASTAAAAQKANATTTVDRRNAIRDELKVLRDTRDDLRSKLQNLENKRSDALAPLRDLFEQRDSLRRQVAEHINRIRVLTDEREARELAQKAEQAKKRQARKEIDRFDRQIKTLEQDKITIQKALANTTAREFDWSSSKAMLMKEYLEHEISTYELAMERLRENASPDTRASSTSDQAIAQSTPEKVELDNKVYVVHRKVVDEAPVVGKRKTKHVKTPAVSNYLNHSMATLRDLKALDVSIPKTVAEAKMTIQELDDIIDAQKAKMSASEGAVLSKQAELQKRMEMIMTREKDLLAKAPPGWKPSSVSVA